MGVELSSREEIEAWLHSRPPEFSQAVALRASLRVLPIALDPLALTGRLIDPRLRLAALRASVLSLAVADSDLDDIPASASAEAAAAAFAASRADGAGRATATAYACDAAAAAASAMSANRAAEAVVYALDAVGYSTAAAGATAGMAARAAARDAAYVDTYVAAAEAAARSSVWGAIVNDCTMLRRRRRPAALLARPLWDQRPEWFQQSWERAAPWLARPDDGFALWRNWYVGRLKGLPHAFDRFDEDADNAFNFWIIEQTDDWWKRDPAAVNADIADKVEELRRIEDQHPDDLFGKATTDFFISYTSANEAAAREVAAILDDLGKSYIAQFRDFAQQNFVNAMNDGLAQAERLIALYSPDYVASGHCMAEWNVFYNLDPSSAGRRIVAFKLEDVDLKPLMMPIVYRDLSRLTGAARQAAIREWIIWEPPQPTRAQVEQVVTATLSPQIVATDDGKLDTQPNPATDQPEYPAELAEALRALQMVLEVVLEEASNLPRPMKRALGGYDQEFTANGAKSSWGGLDRLMTIIAGGLARMAEAEFSEGQKEALEQLIAAHGACMAALKNADKQLRELSAIPLDGTDQARIRELVDRLKEFFERLRDLGLTSDRLDQHVDDLVEQGRDFAFEAGEPDADRRPHSRRQYLLYAGGFGLAALNALGSMASISAVPLAQEAIAVGQAMVEVFFRIVGL